MSMARKLNARPRKLLTTTGQQTDWRHCCTERLNLHGRISLHSDNLDLLQNVFGERERGVAIQSGRLLVQHCRRIIRGARI